MPVISTTANLLLQPHAAPTSILPTSTLEASTSAMENCTSCQDNPQEESDLIIPLAIGCVILFLVLVFCGGYFCIVCSCKKQDRKVKRKRKGKRSPQKFHSFRAQRPTSVPV